MNNQTHFVQQLTLALTSGLTLNVSHIFLSDLSSLNDSAVLRASAERGFSGVNTGVGFLGSPQWAIGGALALGLVEHLASTVAAKEAAKDLQRSAELTSRSLELGEWVNVSDIRNLQTPDVRRWWAISKDGRRPLMHSGEPFLVVLSNEQAQVTLRADHIEFFRTDPPLDPRTSLSDPSLAIAQQSQLSANPSFSFQPLDSRSKLRALNAAAAIQRNPGNAVERRSELLAAVGATISRSEEGEIFLSHSSGSITFKTERNLTEWIDNELVALVTA